MAFTDEIGANSTPNRSGIYGQPGIPTDQDNLTIVNKLKDREMQDFKDKANFMSDLSLKQEQRMRNLFDPNDPKNMNIQDRPQVMMPSASAPGVMSEYQKGELGVRNREADLESQRIAQQGKLGQEAQDTKAAQEKLNQQKSDQIHQQKIDDLTNKQNEYKQKMDLAHEQLKNKTTNLEQQLELHKTIAENTKAYHDAQQAMNDLKFKKSESDHKDAMDAMQKKLDQASHTSTTTEIDAEGNKKTVDVKKGSAVNAPTQNPDGTYTVKDSDGKPMGTIPADKLDDWMQNYHPKVSGGGEEE